MSRRDRRRRTSPAPARVIAADGSVKELPASSISDVLGRSGNTASSFFVCNSDAAMLRSGQIYFNKRPPALSPGEVLRPGQIYFVLPAAMLESPLSTADMAALAVRAATALASSSKPGHHGRHRIHGGGGKKKAVRVMPVREETEDGSEDDIFFNEKLNQQTLGEFGMLQSNGSYAASVPAARDGSTKFQARRRCLFARAASASLPAGPSA